MTYKAALTVFMLVLSAAAPLRAQTGDDMERVKANKERLVQFAANNLDFDQVVEKAARNIFARQFPSCKKIDQVVRQLPRAYGILDFPSRSSAAGALAAPRGGLWGEHVKVRACDRIWQINMLAVGWQAAQPLLLAMMPGETLSDPTAQPLAERMGAITIAKTDASCADTAKAVYTRLLGYRQPDGTMGPKDNNIGWFEEWEYAYCQKKTLTQFAFTPDGAGGFDFKARVVGATAPPPKPASTVPAGPAAPYVAPQSKLN